MDLNTIKSEAVSLEKWKSMRRRKRATTIQTVQQLALAHRPGSANPRAGEFESTQPQSV
jgi:hypothetical protein